ncbi:MAG: heme oxygenase [Alphaproteobacteria bacterium]|nr:heme oxygenase [Alphaproteobacteria bacterium]
MGEAHRHLRAATCEAHRRLDALASRLDLSDLAAYRDFLIASCEALTDIEPRIGAAAGGPPVLDWPARRRLDAARADLLGLGVGEPRTTYGGASLDGCQAWGALYVLEGSRLGATHLAANAMRASHPSIRRNMQYLRHGEGKGFWRSFLACLDAAHGNGLDLAAASAGARAAFAAFEVAFARHALTQSCRS